MKGEYQSRNHLRQREAEKNNKGKGPGAAISPPVNQEKALLLGRQLMPGLIMSCTSDLLAYSATPFIVQETACAQPQSLP